MTTTGSMDDTLGAVLASKSFKYGSSSTFNGGPLSLNNNKSNASPHQKRPILRGQNALIAGTLSTLGMHALNCMDIQIDGMTFKPIRGIMESRMMLILVRL